MMKRGKERGVFLGDIHDQVTGIETKVQVRFEARGGARAWAR